VLKNVAISRESGIGGIKIKVGQPDLPVDIERVTRCASCWATAFR
jgi:hypothetical protein